MTQLASLFQSHKALILFDTETSGLDFDKDQIIELAALRIEQTAARGLRIAGQMDQFIRLPERQRTILSLKAAGYTASEIAGMLGYNTAKAVDNAAYRARRVIRNAETARSERLKAKVDKRLGWNTPPDSFRAAEEYARRKLAILKSRNPGAAGYGEEYLVELTADTLRERQFSRRTIKTHETRLYTAASV